MKLLVLYRDKSDHAREVLDFKETMRRRYPEREVTLMDIDTRDGAAEAVLYDVVRYPAVLVLDDIGRVNYLSQGMPMPLIDEVLGGLLGY